MSKKQGKPAPPAEPPVIVTCYQRTARGKPGWKGIVYVGTSIVHTTAPHILERQARKAAEEWAQGEGGGNG